MADIFLKIFNMSISAGWIVLVVFLLRLFLNKAPKWINCILWAIVGLRLVMPFSLESVFSLIPSTQTISKAPDSPRPHFESGITIVDSRVNDYLGETYFEGVTKPMGIFTDLTSILAMVWIAGVTALLMYTVISYLRLKKKIGTAVKYNDNIFRSEKVIFPFVFGIIKPKIFLPFNIKERDIEYVIAHEKAHIKRKDYLWKPLGFLLLTIYWFNPLMWLGYIFLCRDIELACDEKVVKELSNEQKADYSQALLMCSVQRRMISACPLAFGEVGVKDRVKSVLNYKKPAFWIVAVAIITSIIVAVCFLTNPKTQTDLDIKSLKNGSDLKGLSLEIVNSDLSAPDPYIDIKWTNDTSNEIVFGERFDIFYYQEGKWENCSIEEDTVFHLIGLIASPRRSVEHTYKLNGQIMTKSGKYRFETDFNISGESEKYKAWIEFELKEGIDGITVHSFKPTKLVYDDGMYSYVQTVDVAPNYMIVNGMELIEKANGEISDVLGTFEEITLNKDNFDSRFRTKSDDAWLENDTLKSIKKNNKRAWQLFGVTNSNPPYLYILLEQKDGTFYIGYGYYNCNSNEPLNSADSHIRWLYKLSEVGDSNQGNSEKITWTHLPTLSHTSYYFKTFEFDMVDYTHIKADCDKGALWSNDADGPYYDTVMQYEKGELLRWTPNEPLIDKIPQKSEITFKVYKEETKLYECSVVFECVVRDDDLAEFEIYLKETDGLKIISSGDDIKFVEQSSVSNVGGTVGYNSDTSYIPKMYVTNGNERITAWTGSATWTQKFENGTAQTINADSSHPLDRIDSIKATALRILDWKKDSTLELNFDIVPDSISINGWFFAENGKTKSFDVSVDGTTIKLNKSTEPCLYEVVAIWNNTGEKYGTVHYAFYLSKYSDNDIAIKEIVDETVIKDIPTSDAEEAFYIDENYIYYFTSIKSEYVIVKFDNGDTMTVKQALSQGEISISELDEWGIRYFKKDKIGEWEFDDNGNLIWASSNPKDIYHSTLSHFQTLYEQTPIEQIKLKYDNEEFVITKMHYYNTKKEWCSDGYTYKYRLEITGRMNNAEKNTTYIVLSNKKGITFEQTWKASGLSSLSTDYFKPQDAIIVGHKLFD